MWGVGEHLAGELKDGWKSLEICRGKGIPGGGEQQEQRSGGMRYLDVLKLGVREWQWWGEAGKAGRSKIMLRLQGQVKSDLSRGLE